MAKAIFYKPPPRWHVLGSLAAAIAIELAAVALASVHREEPIPELVAMPSAPVDAVITELPPESTPPPEEEPPPPPPPPDEPTEFTIQEPTPPPRPSAAPPPKPRPKVSENKGTGYSGVANYSSARSNWRSAPRPAYPYEARRAKQTGSGRFLITFDESGNATDVVAQQSTGSAILDQTSINTFMRWKCNPGAYRKVIVPITYTLSGAQL
jgi:TonB family protein